MTQVRRGLLAVLLRMGELGDPQGSIHSSNRCLQSAFQRQWEQEIGPRVRET